jgi:hypothetical protein
MTKTKVVLGGVLTLAMICGGVAVAQMPKDNVSGHKHPNLAAAQQANEWDMDGHAAKAKELLDQVNNELKMAAEAANHNRK